MVKIEIFLLDFSRGGSKMRGKMAISAYIFEKKSRKGHIFKASGQS